jgi:hypothetical protein
MADFSSSARPLALLVPLKLTEDLFDCDFYPLVPDWLNSRDQSQGYGGASNQMMSWDRDSGILELST